MNLESDTANELDEPTMTVCAHCLEQIGKVRAGDDDYLNYCENCQQVEGDTKLISEKEYEEIHG